jgi:hypothetical protein
LVAQCKPIPVHIGVKGVLSFSKAALFNYIVEGVDLGATVLRVNHQIALLLLL